MLFLANIGYVASGRSTLVAVVVLVLLFVSQRFGWKQALGRGGASDRGRGSDLDVVVLHAARACSTPGAIQEVHDYRTKSEGTSSGYRFEFWTRAIVSVAQAPIIGHGTGSQREQFRRTAAGSEEVRGRGNRQPATIRRCLSPSNSADLDHAAHAMWLSHLLLFRGDGLVAWLGTALIVQNIVAGLFNASLVEFTHGWMYIFGVGVLGGMMLRAGRSGVAARQQIGGCSVPEPMPRHVR